MKMEENHDIVDEEVCNYYEIFNNEFIEKDIIIDISSCTNTVFEKEIIINNNLEEVNNLLGSVSLKEKKKEKKKN